MYVIVVVCNILKPRTSNTVYKFEVENYMLKSATTENMFNIWEEKLLKIYEPITEQGVSRVRTNHKLKKLHKAGDVVSVIKLKSLKQLVHVFESNRHG
jgi:hypothetical protein